MPLERAPVLQGLETQVTNCSGLGSQPSYKCGITVYHAGRSMHLFSCGVAVRGGSAPVLEVSGNGAIIGRATGGPDDLPPGSPWPVDNVTLYVLRSPVTGQWSCMGRVGGSARPWMGGVSAAAAVNFSDMTAGIDSFTDPDLWWGPGAAAWGGGNATRGTAVFSYARAFVAPPSVTPADPYGKADACIAPGGVVSRNVTVASTALNATIVGLSQNFPYAARVFALLNTSSVPVRISFVGAPVWARPMPPNHWALGLYLDSKLLTPGRVSSWPDLSGNGHTLKQVCRVRLTWASLPRRDATAPPACRHPSRSSPRP